MCYIFYFKDVVFWLVKDVLMDLWFSRMIDCIIRWLYVISEYGSEKFLLFVWYLRDKDFDVVCDMLYELIEVFDKGFSVWVYFLVYLLKYYMI